MTDKERVVRFKKLHNRFFVDHKEIDWIIEYVDQLQNDVEREKYERTKEQAKIELAYEMMKNLLNEMKSFNSLEGWDVEDIFEIIDEIEI
jgi:hypothetical protein